MVKITKDYAVALGFKTLTHYTSFAEEYPPLAREIKKHFEEGFAESARKSYTLIAEAGIDPVHYIPKTVVKTTTLFQELRKNIPIKKYETIVFRDENSATSSDQDSMNEKVEPVYEPERVKVLEEQVESMSSEIASLQSRKEQLDTREKIIQEKEMLLKKAEAVNETLAFKYAELDEREKKLKERERVVSENEVYNEKLKNTFKDMGRKLDSERAANQNLASNLSKTCIELDRARKENNRLLSIIDLHEKSDRELEKLFKRKRIN